MKKTKTIIITGSEGMIGRSLREYFSKKNFNIIGIDKKKELIQFIAILQTKSR